MGTGLYWIEFAIPMWHSGLMDTEKLVELHRHLDGSIRPQTVKAFAEEQRVDVPSDLLFEPNMGLAAALEKFAFTVSLLQTTDHLAQVAHEMCEDAVEESIERLEIRFAPQLHHCAGLGRVIDAVLEGCSGRAGVILCGLYGDPPDLVDELVSLATKRPMVVGLDLAGGPHETHRYGLTDYQQAFSRAGAAGLGRTVHAGEGRSVSEIRAAIEILGADRIGHGVTLMDDPEVVDLVRSRGVTMEACPTSNWHTGVIERIAEHPLKAWLELDISVAICTDNTLLSNVDLPSEFNGVQRALNLSMTEVSCLRKNASNATFGR
jgi:adenosine deaminase